MFGEYFHGDTAAALGASHQTGWTGLIADVIRRRYGLVRSIGEVIMLVDRQNRGLCAVMCPGRSFGGAAVPRVRASCVRRRWEVARRAGGIHESGLPLKGA